MQHIRQLVIGEVVLQNLVVRLKQTPQAAPSVQDFICEEEPLGELVEGQVLVKSQWLSLDPYMRSQIAGRHLTGGVKPGDVMSGEAVGEVVESRSPLFKNGDRVRGMLGWQRFAIVSADSLSIIDSSIPEARWTLSMLGMPGLTAWAGTHVIARPKPGDTLVVPAATGAVGSMVLQFARQMSCRVVAIAGGPEKCRYAVEVLGAEVCIDRHSEDLGEALDKHCPDGINFYFDLVGGDTLEQVSRRLANYAQVVLCGMTADYNRSQATPPPGPSPAYWIRSRAVVSGLVVYDFEPRRQEFLDSVLPLAISGKLHLKEDITQGLENAPQAFARLMRGGNFGKTLVQID